MQYRSFVTGRLVGGWGGAAKQFGINAAWHYLRPLQWAEITFQKALLSPMGAAVTGWTLFVFPPKAAGFRGREGEQCDERKEGFEWKWDTPRFTVSTPPLLKLCRLNATGTWPQAKKYCCKDYYFVVCLFLFFLNHLVFIPSFSVHVHILDRGWYIQYIQHKSRTSLKVDTYWIQCSTNTRLQHYIMLFHFYVALWDVFLSFLSFD